MGRPRSRADAEPRPSRSYRAQGRGDGARGSADPGFARVFGASGGSSQRLGASGVFGASGGSSQLLGASGVLGASGGSSQLLGASGVFGSSGGDVGG